MEFPPRPLSFRRLTPLNHLEVCRILMRRVLLVGKGVAQHHELCEGVQPGLRLAGAELCAATGPGGLAVAVVVDAAPGGVGENHGDEVLRIRTRGGVQHHDRVVHVEVQNLTRLLLRRSYS